MQQIPSLEKLATKTHLERSNPGETGRALCQEEKRVWERSGENRASAEPVMGFEPMTPVLPRLCATPAPHGPAKTPARHPRMGTPQNCPHSLDTWLPTSLAWWVVEDSNLRRPVRTT